VFLAEDAGSGGSGLLSFLPILLILAAFYFLLIRPQNKRRREQQELQSRIAPGDEVRTTSGLYGIVVATDDESVTIEAAPGVELRFIRGAIGNVVPQPVDEPEEEESEEEDVADEPAAETDRTSKKKPDND
jgi:preprotein translocase subunit YajC